MGFESINRIRLELEIDDKVKTLRQEFRAANRSTRRPLRSQVSRLLSHGSRFLADLAARLEVTGNEEQATGAAS